MTVFIEFITLSKECSVSDCDEPAIGSVISENNVSDKSKI
jgi:hypothetical protein